MPRFVILEHDHPFLHWDLMLENGGALRTWRLLAEPDSADEIDAEPLPDHRLAYLDYEGPVRGGRGMVARWDIGKHELRHDEPDCVEVELHGERLRGEYRLTARDDDPTRWSLERLAGN